MKKTEAKTLKGPRWSLLLFRKSKDIVRESWIRAIHSRDRASDWKLNGRDPQPGKKPTNSLRNNGANRFSAKPARSLSTNTNDTVIQEPAYQSTQSSKSFEGEAGTVSRPNYMKKTVIISDFTQQGNTQGSTAAHQKATNDVPFDDHTSSINREVIVNCDEPDLTLTAEHSQIESGSGGEYGEQGQKADLLTLPSSPKGPEDTAELWRVVRPGGVDVRAGPKDTESLVCTANCGDVLQVVSRQDASDGAVWLRLLEAWQWQRHERMWRRAARAWVKMDDGNASQVEPMGQWGPAQVGKRGRGLWKVAAGGVQIAEEPEPGAKAVRRHGGARAVAGATAP